MGLGYLLLAGGSGRVDKCVQAWWGGSWVLVELCSTG